MTLKPVILCGGAGTRLWPASRGARPKQFLDLFETGTTLFQDTLARVAAIAPDARPMVVCGPDQAATAREQAGATPVDLLIEPAARNTAPAIALAALTVPADTLLLICPSDHRIADVPAFASAVARACDAARGGALVTFGITPDRPETGYGYIERGAALSDGVWQVATFTEKPDTERAAAMVAGGRHDWNAGIFLMRAASLLSAMEAHWAEGLARVRAAMTVGSDGAVAVDAQAFAAVEPLSIDHAVMERADTVAVVPVAMGWSDVGGWAAVHAISAKDAAGNAAPADVLLTDCRGMLVRSDGPVVAALGVEGLAVIVSDGVVMICPLERAQEARALAAAHSSAKGSGDIGRS